MYELSQMSYNYSTASLPEHVDEPKKMNATSDITTRHAFIRKVYTILSVQLLVTFSMIALFSLNESIKDYIQSKPEILWSAILLSLVLICALLCCRTISQLFPLNYIVLGCFTVCEGYLLGTISSYYDTMVVFYAVLLTFAVTFGLTIFACQTKYDFTGMGGYLVGALIVLILSGIILSLLCIGTCYIANMIYSAIGALIFSMFIVYDTQLIVGGNHFKYQFSEADYVIGALSLYLDVINLFLYILSLLGGGSRN